METLKIYRYANKVGYEDRYQSLRSWNQFDRRMVTYRNGRRIIIYTEPVVELIDNYGNGYIPNGIEIKEKLILSNNQKMKDKTYALYRGDKLLSIGTLEKIAKDMNVTVKTIIHYGTPAWRNRKDANWETSRILIKIEDDKEDEDEE